MYHGSYESWMCVFAHVHNKRDFKRIKEDKVIDGWNKYYQVIERKCLEQDWSFSFKVFRKVVLPLKNSVQKWKNPKSFMTSSFDTLQKQVLRIMGKNLISAQMGLGTQDTAPATKPHMSPPKEVWLVPPCTRRPQHPHTPDTQHQLSARRGGGYWRQEVLGSPGCRFFRTADGCAARMRFGKITHGWMDLQRNFFLSTSL